MDKKIEHLSDEELIKRFLKLYNKTIKTDPEFREFIKIVIEMDRRNMDFKKIIKRGK